MKLNVYALSSPFDAQAASSIGAKFDGYQDRVCLFAKEHSYCGRVFSIFIAFVDVALEALRALDVLSNLALSAINCVGALFAQDGYSYEDAKACLKEAGTAWDRYAATAIVSPLLLVAQIALILRSPEQIESVRIDGREAES